MKRGGSGGRRGSWLHHPRGLWTAEAVGVVASGGGLAVRLSPLLQSCESPCYKHVSPCVCGCLDDGGDLAAGGSDKRCSLVCNVFLLLLLLLLPLPWRRSRTLCSARGSVCPTSRTRPCRWAGRTTRRCSRR